MEDSKEMYLGSFQLNHPTSYPSAKIGKKWVEHGKRDRERQKEVEREMMMMKEDESRKPMWSRGTGRKKRECAHNRRSIRPYKLARKRKNMYYTFLFAHYLVHGLTER